MVVKKSNDSELPLKERRGSRRKRVDRNAAAAIVPTLTDGETFLSNAKVYGSLHDAFFHYIQNVREIAIESVKRWFPELVDLVDFDKLEIHTQDFYDRTLKKRAVDLIYTIQLRDGSGTLPIALILEHKAQSSQLENASTLAQTLDYVVSFCREEIKKRREASRAKGDAPIMQPIVVVIYTGRDMNLKGLKWQDSFYLPESLKRYRVGYSPLFVNMTRLSVDKKLNASPFFRVAYDLMALASLGKLEGAERFVLKPLSGVVSWGAREQNLLLSMGCYFLRSATNAKIPVDRSTIETLFRSTNHGDESTMKSVWAEIGDEVAKNEKKKGLEEGIGIGVEKGIGIGVEKGIRDSIDNVAAARFKKRSRKLSSEIGRVSDVDQLNAILAYAASQATSINDVVAYVGALR